MIIASNTGRRPGVPMNAVAYYVQPGSEQRCFIVPMIAESDQAAIRRVASEEGFDPRDVVFVRNLR